MQPPKKYSRNAGMKMAVTVHSTPQNKKMVSQELPQN